MPPSGSILFQLRLARTINKHSNLKRSVHTPSNQMGGSHPRKSNLRTFLKKEIQKRRLKAPEIDPLDASDCTPTDGNMRAGVDHQLALQNSADNSILGSPANSMYGREDSDFSSQSGDPIDNLFGEPLGTPSLREQELQRLLAEHNPIVPVAKFTESSKLKDLKDELKVVILLETDGNTSIREHALIQRQKGSLIEEIRYMGEVERRVFESMSCLIPT